MELLLNPILGIVLTIVSIVMIRKEKYATSAIIKYFAAYMYISLAYETYQVLPNETMVLLFVALALSCIGDVVVCLKDLTEQFKDLTYYFGIALYIAESIILIATRFDVCTNPILLVVIGVAVSVVLSFLLLRKEEVSLIDKIAGPLLMACCLVQAAIGIGAVIALPSFANTLFCIGSVFIGLSSVFYVVERHFNHHFAFKATCLVLRYLSQLMFMFAMIFILY